MTEATEKTLIVIPTYNEKENLPLLLEAIFKIVPQVNVLVVDDNSPDGTGKLADELAAADGRIHVHHREQKQGLGRAYVAGFKWALEHSYDLVFEMDCDFSHRPEHLPEFLEAIKDADLVLGSRYIRGGGTEGWGWHRKFISGGGNFYARTVLGLPYRDLTGGFKCFRRKVLESLDLDALMSYGYSFQIELTFRTHNLGFRVKEIPIIFPDRTRGQSKMSGKIFKEAFVMVWRLRKARGQGAAFSVPDLSGNATGHTAGSAVWKCGPFRFFGRLTRSAVNLGSVRLWSVSLPRIAHPIWCATKTAACVSSALSILIAIPASSAPHTLSHRYGRGLTQSCSGLH